MVGHPPRTHAAFTWADINGGGPSEWGPGGGLPFRCRHASERHAQPPTSAQRPAPCKRSPGRPILLPSASTRSRRCPHTRPCERAGAGCRCQPAPRWLPPAPACAVKYRVARDATAAATGAGRSSWISGCKPAPVLRVHVGRLGSRQPVRAGIKEPNVAHECAKLRVCGCVCGVGGSASALPGSGG